MCTELIGITQLAKDWGEDVKGTVWVDSNAAIGVACRRGCGKLRHVKVGTLWIQERVEDGDVKIRKVAGEENPADMMTKNLNEGKVEKLMMALNKYFKEGRAEASLKLKVL